MKRPTILVEDWLGCSVLDIQIKGKAKLWTEVKIQLAGGTIVALAKGELHTHQARVSSLACRGQGTAAVAATAEIGMVLAAVRTAERGHPQMRQELDRVARESARCDLMRSLKWVVKCIRMHRETLTREDVLEVVDAGKMFDEVMVEEIMYL